MEQPNQKFANYVRNFIFGAEDSLVSTVGLLSGIAVGGVERSTIVLTGLVLIFVEAFSMGVGSFLSEYSAEEYLQGEKFQGMNIAASFIMFISYVAMGLVPLWPYLVFENETALVWSIASSLIALFVLGIVSAKILKIRQVKSGLRMLLIGGVAILIGVVVANFIR